MRNDTDILGTAFSLLKPGQPAREDRQAWNKPFSDFIVYVDESGDHGLENMDASYPMFVLAFCIFRKPEYLAQVVPVFRTRLRQA